jgi:hypothetical protein
MPYFRVSPVFAGEGATFVEFTVALDEASTNEVKVSYSTLNGTANYNSSAPDFQALSGTLSFAAGETSKTLRVNLVNNTTRENTEIFWLSLSSPVNATVSQALAPALLFDNDATAGTPAVAVSDAVVDEAGHTASFAVWLNKPSTSTVTVSYATADDSALAGQDYGANAGVLSFAPGEVAKTVTVNITNDGTAEVDEFFRLVLNSPGNASIVDGTGIAQIGRNDQAPVGAPYVTARPIASDESQPVATFVVQLSAPSTNEVRVNYNLLNGTANYNSSAPDFQNNNGTLVFAPGQTTLVVTMPVVDNTTVETTGMMWLELSSPVNAIVPQRLTPALMLDNDRTAGTPGISVGDAVVDETAGTVSFFVWLDKPSVNVVTVGYASVDDTATAGTDYRAASGSLSFAPGEIVKTVTLDIHDDALAEGNESFRLVLASPVNATLTDGSGAVLIGRSDLPRVSQPQVLAGPVTVSEADGVATVLVQLSAASTNEVRVNYNFANGTANYNSSAPNFQNHSGTLVFAPGETTRLLTVALVDNTTAEGSEAFTLELTSPVNATVPQRQTSITIIDDDSGFVVYSRGTGHDLYTVASALDGIAESPGGGIDTVRSGVSYTLPENVENLVLTGSALNGIGNAGNNLFRGTGNNNSFDGKEGIDTVAFTGGRAAYTVNGSAASRTVAGGVDGSDSLFSIERLQFSDQILASDTLPGGNTYLAYALFNAAFNQAPDTAALSRWTAQLDRLGNLTDTAQALINAYAPGVPDDVLVSYLWSTIIGGAIPADALATYTGLLANGSFSQGSILALVTTLEFNTVEIAGIVGQTLTLDPAYFPLPG